MCLTTDDQGTTGKPLARDKSKIKKESWNITKERHTVVFFLPLKTMTLQRDVLMPRGIQLNYELAVTSRGGGRGLLLLPLEGICLHLKLWGCDKGEAMHWRDLKKLLGPTER